MRILLWHGYLLTGTGSNVYTRLLARAWARDGHDVTVFCQDPHPELLDLGGARVIRPDIDGPLPVFVLDHYEGMEPRLLQDLSVGQRQHFVDVNAAAIREHLPADLIFTNHVLLGGPVGAATGAPFAVKAHGSELEYSMRGRPELAQWGAASLSAATATYVGSEHIARVLTDVCGPVPRVHEVPPGVDVDEWRPQPRTAALDALIAAARQDPPNPGNRNERLPDEGNAERLADFLADDEPTVIYVGKLSRNKGVHLLMQAMAEINARTVVVGFGEERPDFEAIAPKRTLFTGALDHRHLVHLLPLADVSVVPSVFPEAFGMVAAEAAAAGTPPVVARHSGLAEVAARLAAAYPPELAHLAAFTTDDVADLRDKLTQMLALAPDRRAELGRIARQVAAEHWSWSSVAQRLLDTYAASI